MLSFDFHKGVFFCVLLCFMANAHAASYYFSSATGNDGYSSRQAQNKATPWKSLSKLNSFFSSLQPGDSVLLKRDDVFFGCLQVASSGDAGNPIVVGAYGKGDNPVISGLVALTGWTFMGNGIWESAASPELWGQCKHPAGKRGGQSNGQVSQCRCCQQRISYL